MKKCFNRQKTNSDTYQHYNYEKNIVSHHYYERWPSVHSQLLTGCESRKQDSKTGHDHTKTDSTAASFACPMHPEVTGKEGDTCSKCGMKLVAVKSNDTSKHEH
jgi:hypothetical protein